MVDAQDMTLKVGFPPVADERTRVLVLGSLPGEASLERRQYYANPTNQFWRLMGGVVETDLAVLDYEARLAALLRARVGLWDVIGSARRTGSLDAQIRNHAANPLGTIASRFPSLRALAFNGGKSYQIGRRLLGEAAGVKLVPLPSSSAAYCSISVDAKQAKWDGLKPFIA